MEKRKAPTKSPPDNFKGAWTYRWNGSWKAKREYARVNEDYREETLADLTNNIS